MTPAVPGEPRAFGPEVDVEVLARPCPGETVSGDGALVLRSGAGLLVVLADGLGHGPEAHAAAQAALAQVAAAPAAPLEELLEACDRALKDGRGAALAIARLDLAADRAVFLGIGNISGWLSGARRVRLLSQPGVVGGQRRERPRPPQQAPFAPGDALVLHTDGVSDSLDLHPGFAAGELFEAHAQARDDATLVVVRRAPRGGGAP